MWPGPAELHPGSMWFVEDPAKHQAGVALAQEGQPSDFVAARTHANSNTARLKSLHRPPLSCSPIVACIAVSVTPERGNHAPFLGGIVLGESVLGISERADRLGPARNSNQHRQILDSRGRQFRRLPTTVQRLRHQPIIDDRTDITDATARRPWGNRAVRTDELLALS